MCYCFFIEVSYTAHWSWMLSSRMQVMQHFYTSSLFPSQSSLDYNGISHQEDLNVCGFHTLYRKTKPFTYFINSLTYLSLRFIESYNFSTWCCFYPLLFHNYETQCFFHCSYSRIWEKNRFLHIGVRQYLLPSNKPQLNLLRIY